MPEIIIEKLMKKFSRMWTNKEHEVLASYNSTIVVGGIDQDFEKEFIIR